jgi:two-component system response regulator DctR/two-component system response regulator FixJ
MGDDLNQTIPRSSMPRFSANVYLVDNDTDGLQWLDDLVQRWNLKVFRFSSAEQFLGAGEPDEPGVVVAEVNLPGMNGLELHQELVRRGCRLPTIIVARNGDVPGAVQALQAGAEDFLEKPVVPQVLLRRIRTTLAASYPRDTD